MHVKCYVTRHNWLMLYNIGVSMLHKCYLIPIMFATMVLLNIFPKYLLCHSFDMTINPNIVMIYNIINSTRDYFLMMMIVRM